MTVRTAGGDVDLLVELARPTRLETVLADIRSCVGLPADVVLNLGVGPVEPSWVLGRAPLLAGCVLSTVPSDKAVAVGTVNLSCVAGPDAGRWVALDSDGVVIGRDPACDLTLDDPEMSRRHARICSADRGTLITDLNSANGLRVDGELRSAATPVSVPLGGLIRLGGSIFRAGFDSEPTLLLTPDGKGRLAVARPARVARSFDHPLPPPVGPMPERSRRPIPLLAAVIGALAGGAIAAITGIWTFLLLAALGPLMMVVSALSDRASGRRGHRRALAEHRTALRIEAGQLEAGVTADREDAWDRYPDPATLLRRAVNCSTRLWERGRGDPAFLHLAVGVGQRNARLACADPVTAVEVPITVDLAAVGVLGLTSGYRALLRQLLAQVAALHSPADLRIVVFSAETDLARTKDLPQAMTDAARGMFPTAAGAAAAVARLLDSQDERVTLVLLDGADRWRRTPRMNELLGRAAQVNGGSRFVAICASPTVAALPVECRAVATVRNGRVRIAVGQDTIEAGEVGVSREYLEQLINALAPLVDPDAPGSELPREVLMSALLAPVDIRTSMSERWARPGLAAPIGTWAGGSLSIDLERDGPHLLIAGTTGSGKSELLQTVIAGLAIAAPPDRTTFLLIDYKGGAAFGRLAELPHTTGVITDLDFPLAARALISLRAELRRREHLLAEHQVADLAGLRDRCAAPPSLVVVVDEFATLAADQPDFLAGLLDIAQRGRSLGLHLILATQRPAGVISPAMKANIGLRICLRVADDADSIDVVDSNQAARLPLGVPGRAVLRFSRSRSILFQVARVSATPIGGHRVRRRTSGPDTLPGSGPAPGFGPTVEAGPSDLSQVVGWAGIAATGIETPLPPWLPPLPTGYASTDPVLIGLVDRPAEQRQVGWSAPSGSVMVLGSPASGRSSALRRFGWTAAAAGADLLIIDPGQGLRELAAWPSVRTHLDGQDPLLVQRVVGRLADEHRLRSATPGSPLMLLVDGWELISGPLDALDYGSTMSAIADLAARGPAAGITVVISGDLQLQHHRIASSFITTVRLGIDERGTALLNGPVVGRGRVGTDEIQIAQCDRDVPPTPVTRRVRSRRAAIVVRALPETVDRRHLPPAVPDAIPVGIGGDDASPQFIDLSGPGGGLLVSGPRRTGVSTALVVLAGGAVQAGIRVVRGCLQPLSAMSGVLDIDLRAGVAELRALLTEHQGPVLLIADDVDGWSEAGTDLLERFVTVAGPGQYLAAGCRLDRALRAHRGPITEVAALRTGILLHADSADGALLDAAIPRRRGQAGPGRGHLVLAGRVVPLQVAAVGPADPA